ncbi:MAG: VPLPA-CTERM sorting domain-containing protein [Proteobacteria bacterium]|nr:VPLPA-CTERM sorting domain-containing protein [Pseudomonadota bacterium]
MKSLLTAIATAGVIAFAAAGAQASTTFNLGGSYVSGADSLYYHENGIGLTVTAQHYHGSGNPHSSEKVTRFGAGVGAKNWSHDDPLVDGNNHYNDVVNFNFDQTVKLESVMFSYFDDEKKRIKVCVARYHGWCVDYDRIWVPAPDDEFSFFAEKDGEYQQIANNLDGNPYNFIYDWIGDKFGIGASDKNDEFLIKSITVSAVPLPAALPLYGAGLAVMGFVGWRKRRKAAAQA